jgi:hypothetical protein
VQCKRHKDKVGNKAVQEVLAAKSIATAHDASVARLAIARPSDDGRSGRLECSPHPNPLTRALR